MPAGFSLVLLCPLGLTSDILKGLFNECLQEFICFYALQDALLMSLKAFFI